MLFIIVFNCKSSYTNMQIIRSKPSRLLSFFSTTILRFSLNLNKNALDSLIGLVSTSSSTLYLVFTSIGPIKITITQLTCKYIVMAMSLFACISFFSLVFSHTTFLSTIRTPTFYTIMLGSIYCLFVLFWIFTLDDNLFSLLPPGEISTEIYYT